MQNIADNIWRITGSRPGPSLLLLGGVHGNETAGIEVVKMLREAFNAGTLTLLAGTLTLGIGNLKAVSLNTRFIEGRDLNRYFTDVNLAGQDGSEEERRAIELAKLIREADVTIDVHSTNKPSAFFVCSKNDSAHENIYRWFSPEIVLTDPNYILGGQPATTDEYADRMGNIGMCIEAGDVADTKLIPAVFESIKAIMGDIGMISETPKIEPSKPKSSYMLIEGIMLTSQGFRFAEGKGKRSFEPVSKDEIIGYHGNTPEVAKENGVIVFPKMPEHQVVGKPVGYFAKEI